MLTALFGTGGPVHILPAGGGLARRGGPTTTSCLCAATQDGADENWLKVAWLNDSMRPRAPLERPHPSAGVVGPSGPRDTALMRHARFGY